HRAWLVIVPLFRIIGDADFRKPVTQGVARETQQTRGLAFVSVGATESFANHLVFPMLEGHAFGKKTAGGVRRLTALQIHAATSRTSTLIVRVPPSRSNSRSCRTRNNFTCVAGGTSPISSRNSVPLSASSNFPGLLAVAPVNAPFS